MVAGMIATVNILRIMGSEFRFVLTLILMSLEGMIPFTCILLSFVFIFGLAEATCLQTIQYDGGFLFNIRFVFQIIITNFSSVIGGFDGPAPLIYQGESETSTGVRLLASWLFFMNQLFCSVTMLNFLVAVLAEFFGEALFHKVASDYKQKIALLLECSNLFFNVLRFEDAGDLYYIYNISLLEQDESKKVWEGRIKRSEDIMKTLDTHLSTFKVQVGNDIDAVKDT